MAAGAWQLGVSDQREGNHHGDHQRVPPDCHYACT